MKKGNYFSSLIKLFWSFFKLGALTFGGGYAMIPLIQKEVVDKRKWITDLEMIDIIAIAESTPGPVAVNTATFVGFKVKGFLGSFFATLGLAIPSFLIIFLISFIYEKFLYSPILMAMFKGLRIGVIILLSNAVIRLSKNIKINAFNIVMITLTIAGMIITTFLQVKINIGSFNLSISLLFILLGLLIGILFTAFRRKE